MILTNSLVIMGIVNLNAMSVTSTMTVEIIVMKKDVVRTCYVIIDYTCKYIHSIQLLKFPKHTCIYTVVYSTFLTILAPIIYHDYGHLA